MFCPVYIGLCLQSFLTTFSYRMCLQHVKISLKSFHLGENSCNTIVFDAIVGQMQHSVQYMIFLELQISQRIKALFFAFTLQTEILKCELSRRKLRKISRKFTQTTFFLSKISQRNSAKTRQETLWSFSAKFEQILHENTGVISKNVNSLNFCFVWFVVLRPSQQLNYGNVETVN